jgi:formyl-CoA transferase
MTAGVFSWLSGSIIAGLKEIDDTQSLYIPHYGIFRTSDNKFITLGIVHEEHFWRNLCSVIDLGELKDLQILDRVNRREEIFKALNSAFMTKTRDEWVDIFTKVDVPFGPVLTVKESFAHSQIKHRGQVYDIEDPLQGKIRQRGFPVKFADSKDPKPTPPPLLGQHTEEILSRLDYKK